MIHDLQIFAGPLGRVGETAGANKKKVLPA